MPTIVVKAFKDVQKQIWLHNSSGGNYLCTGSIDDPHPYYNWIGPFSNVPPWAVGRQISGDYAEAANWASPGEYELEILDYQCRPYLSPGITSDSVLLGITFPIAGNHILLRHTAYHGDPDNGGALSFLRDENGNEVIFQVLCMEVNLSATPVSGYTNRYEITSEITGGVAPFEYAWSTNGVITISGGSTSDDFIIVEVEEGESSVVIGLEVNDSDGCSAQDAISLCILDVELETSETDTTFTATATPTGGTAPYIYYWTYGGDLQDETGDSITVDKLPAGSIALQVYVFDSEGCSGSARSTVGSIPESSSSSDISSSSENPDDYKWYCVNKDDDDYCAYVSPNELSALENFGFVVNGGPYNTDSECQEICSNFDPGNPGGSSSTSNTSGGSTGSNSSTNSSEQSSLNSSSEISSSNSSEISSSSTSEQNSSDSSDSSGSDSQSSSQESSLNSSGDSSQNSSLSSNDSSDENSSNSSGLDSSDSSNTESSSDSDLPSESSADSSDSGNSSLNSSSFNSSGSSGSSGTSSDSSGDLNSSSSTNSSNNSETSSTVSSLTSSINSSSSSCDPPEEPPKPTLFLNTITKLASIDIPGPISEAVLYTLEYRVLPGDWIVYVTDVEPGSSPITIQLEACKTYEFRWIAIKE